MSQLLTLSDIKNSRIPPTLGICKDDERIVQWVNEAQTILLNQGRWWGSVRTAQFCVDNSGCFVFPREVAVVERIAVCGTPIPMENSWYQFSRLIARVESCSGCSTGSTRRGGCNHLQYEDRTTAASFSTTLGNNKVIRSYISQTADVGKKIIYQGRDKNGIWVRTSIDGRIQDGERVTLADPFVDTVTIWGPGSPTGVIKDATDYNVPVFEYDPDTTTERLLSNYEPDETKPMYRVGFIPHFNQVHCGGCCGTTPEKSTVTAQVSLQHVPIVNDNDWLIFQNLPAYKAAMIAVKAWEENDEAKGNFHFYGTQSSPTSQRSALRTVNRAGAIPLLSAELEKMTGGRVNTMVYIDETNRSVRDMIGFI